MKASPAAYDLAAGIAAVAGIGRRAPGPGRTRVAAQLEPTTGIVPISSRTRLAVSLARRRSRQRG